MSIAIVGPEKYDFQDRVCVYLGLRFRHLSAVTLTPEPTGREDAELTWSDANGPWTLEVQVKGAKGDLPVSRLIDYLAHFPDNETTGALIERLIADPRRAALFIVTARAGDDVAILGVDKDWVGEMDRLLRLRDLKDLATLVQGGLPQASVGAIKAGQPTKTQAERQAHLATLGALPLASLTDALRRVFIIQGFTEADVDVRLQAGLRSGWRIATDRLQAAISATTRVIVKAKRSQTNILPQLAEALEPYAAVALAPANYMARGDEDTLLASLSIRRAVLLAGQPRTGKSWLAMTLAGRLQTQGFEVQHGAHVEVASRFLLDPSDVERVYVLEDPLGPRLLDDRGAAILFDLTRLLGQLPDHRRLIVAQSLAPLLEACGAMSLFECALSGHDWLELTPAAPGLALAIWRQAAGLAKLPEDEVERVAQAIARREDLRAPGAIAYLAQTLSGLGDSPRDDDALVASAYGDARDYARLLSGQAPDARALLTALALSTEPGAGASDKELAFILDGGEDRPGLDQTLQAVRLTKIFDDLDPEAVEHPTYATEPVLTPGQRDALDMLHRRRVVEGEIAFSNFVHPYGQAAAQLLVLPELPRDAPAALARAERALACLAPRSTLAAARALPWMARLMEQRPGGAKPIFDLAISGLGSIFPATRDACYEFLMSRSDQLPADLASEISYWTGLVDITIDEVEARGDLLMIVPDSDIRREFEEVELTAVAPYLDAIEGGAPLDLDLLQTRLILRALSAAPDAMTLTLFRRLLSADESVVRAEAARIWFTLPRTGDEAELERLARDVSPQLSAAILRRLARKWDQLDANRREAVLKVLESQVASPGSASLVLRHLSVFDRVERFGANPPWVVFARLLPKAMANLPPAVNFDDGRLRNAVMHAISSGQAIDLEPLFTTWADHLLRVLASHVPGEMELAVVELMLRGLAPERRWPLIARLLAAPSTAALMLFLLDLMKGWETLSERERQGACDLVAEARADAIWLRAVVLTHEIASPPLVIAALDGRAAPVDLASALQILSPEQFAACVRTFVGSTSTLRGLVLQHGGGAGWVQILVDLARLPDDPFWSLAFEDVLNRHDDAALADIVASVDERFLDAVFERLLTRKIADNGFWRQEAWLALLERGEAAGLLDDWMARIDAVLIAFIERPRDVVLWLGKTRFAEQVLGMIEADLAALRAVNSYLEIPDIITAKFSEGDNDLRDDALDKVKAVVRSNMQAPVRDGTLRLHETIGMIRDGLKALDAPDGELASVEQKRLEKLAELRAIQPPVDRWESKAVLTGWIGPV